MLFLLMLFLLMLCGLATASRPSLIPSPNVCGGVSSSNRVFSSWESSDCPMEALCIPYTNNGSFCSCAIGPGIYDREDRRCVLSTASYVFITLFGALSAFSFCLVLWGCWEIRRAERLGHTRKDFAFALGVLSVLCMVVQTISTAMLAVWISTLPDSTRTVLYYTSYTALVLLVIIALMIVVVFGVTVLQIAMDSVKVRLSNNRRSTNRVVQTVVAVVLVLICASIPLVLFRQVELMRVLWGLSAFFGALLYHYTLGWVLQLTSAENSKGKAKVKQVAKAIKAIKRLSLRLLIPLTTYAILEVLHSICVFVGKDTRSELLLGTGVYVFNVLHNLLVCVGVAFVIKYFRSISNARTMQVTPTQNATDSSQVDTSAFSTKTGNGASWAAENL